MKIKRRALLFVTGLSVPFLLASGFNQPRSSSKAIIINESPVAIETINLSVGGSNFSEDNIKPNKKKSFNLRLNGNGPFNVSGTFENGDTIQSTSLGFVSSSDNNHHYFKVQADGSVDYEKQSP